MKLLLLSAVTAMWSVIAVAAGAGVSGADPFVPGPTNCGGPGQPGCLPGIPAEAQCALVAWQTFQPCNWRGVAVAPGTPGSW